MTNAAQDPELTAAEQLTQVLRDCMTVEYGEGTNISGLVRLSAGASRETWSFDAQKPNGDYQPLILKRDPMDRQVDKQFDGVPEGRLAVDRLTEGRLIQLADEAGVPEPVVPFGDIHRQSLLSCPEDPEIRLDQDQQVTGTVTRQLPAVPVHCSRNHDHVLQTPDDIAVPATVP